MGKSDESRNRMEHLIRGMRRELAFSDCVPSAGLPGVPPIILATSLRGRRHHPHSTDRKAELSGDASGPGPPTNTRLS